MAHLKRGICALVLALAVAVCMGSPVAEQTGHLWDASNQTVADVLSSQNDLSIFTGALQALGLKDLLRDASLEATVLAPNNAAIKEYLAQNWATYISQPALSENTTLQAVILYHLVPGGYMDLTGQEALTSVLGQSINVTADDEETVLLRSVWSEVVVNCTGLRARQGVVYKLNQVLVPSMELLAFDVSVLASTWKSALRSALQPTDDIEADDLPAELLLEGINSTVISTAEESLSELQAAEVTGAALVSAVVSEEYATGKHGGKHGEHGGKHGEHGGKHGEHGDKHGEHGDKRPEHNDKKQIKGHHHYEAPEEEEEGTELQSKHAEKELMHLAKSAKKPAKTHDHELDDKDEEEHEHEHHGKKGKMSLKHKEPENAEDNVEQQASEQQHSGTKAKKDREEEEEEEHKPHKGHKDHHKGHKGHHNGKGSKGKHWAREAEDYLEVAGELERIEEAGEQPAGPHHKDGHKAHHHSGKEKTSKHHKAPVEEIEIEDEDEEESAVGKSVDEAAEEAVAAAAAIKAAAATAKSKVNRFTLDIKQQAQQKLNKFAKSSSGST